jgi:hypothetical protein
MLFNTVKNRNYTVDYKGYTIITSADGTVTTKRYDTIPTSIKVQISTSFTGDLIILADEKLQLEGYLENLVDRNGNIVYEDALWRISSTQPVVNAVGLVEGYKYKAKIISGNV